MKRILYTFLMGMLCVLSSMAQPFNITLSSAESGTKTHQARNSITFAAGYSYTPSGGTMTAEIVNPVVTGDMDYASAINPSSYTINSSLPVGKNQGGFQSSGFANYSVPLDLPKGTAGIQPMINLSYMSNFNDGLMGVGWNIDGLSTISRVNKTIYYDSKSEIINGNLNDAYALDGKKLILTGGTYGTDNSTYGTELEDFSKIVAHGSTGQGPQYFTVYSKSGLIYEYGNTTDSKLMRDGSCILTWKLNKITDRYNNYIVFNYFDSDDEHPIYSIEYTGNSSLSKAPFAQINFWYKRRSDISTYCYGGKEFTRDLLLDNIEIKNNGQTYKKYQMTYMKDNYAQLLKITQSSSSSQLLNPTVFSWTDQTEQYTQTTHYSSSVNEQFFHGDFNGDGRTDFVTVPIPDPEDGFSSTDKWKLYLANTTGGMVYTSEGTMDQFTTDILAADMDGDGLTDLIMNTSSGRYVNFKFYKSTGSNFSISTRSLLGSANLNGTSIWSIVDIGGDGKLEIFIRNPDAPDYDPWDPNSTTIPKIVAYSYTGTRIFQDFANIEFGNLIGSQSMTGSDLYHDFNGDGSTDILSLYQDEYKIFEFKGSSSKPIVTHTGTNLNNSNAVLLGDFNGDGTTDIIKTSGPVNPQWTLMCFTKDGLREHSISGVPNFNLYGDNNRWNSADFNGDGKMDLLLWGKGTNTSNSPNHLWLATNKGNGYDYEWVEYTSSVNFSINAQQTYTNISWWENLLDVRYFYFGDYNGDGREQFFYKNGSTSKLYSFASGTPSNLLANVIDGLGAQTKITYKPMSNSSVYMKYSTGSYPLCNFSSSIQLVSQVDFDDGLGGFITKTYLYEGAKVHKQGKGFVGFSKITTTNSDTGMREIKTFNFHPTRYFAQIDDVINGHWDGSSLNTISTESNTWDEISLSNNRIFPYISYKGENDDLLNLSVSTTIDYNPYGSGANAYANLMSVSKAFERGRTTTTSYSYSNENTSSWLIGRPTTITETSVRSGQTKTFTTSRTYFSTNNSPDIDWYNSGDASYWKLDRIYDAYGNLSGEQKITTGLSTQTTVYVYDQNDGVNLLSVTDPAGNETEYTYDPTTRKLKTITDPFGNLNTYNYNTADQLSSIVPTGGITTTISSSLGAAGGPLYSRFYVQRSGSDGSLTKTWYDKLGRELRVETKNLSGSMVKVDKQYNNKGQFHQVSEPTTGTPSYWNVTNYSTDDGRVTSLDPYYGPTTSFSYPDISVTKTVNSRNYTSVFDAEGLVTSRTDPGGNITYSYWPDGTLRSTLAPGNVTTSMTYDKNGNRLTITDPSAGTITNTWYGTGQVKTLVNNKGQTTTYTYQSNGLLDYYTSPEGQTNYSYNQVNQVSNITTPGGASRSYTYDTKGRVSTISESIGGISNTVTINYDSKGRLYRKYFNGSTDYEQYDYNSYGYLYRIQFNGSTVWQLTGMDEYGHITNANIGSTAATWSYDSNKLLSGISATGVQDYDYSFDVNTGNLNSRTNYLKSKTESFGYDTDKLDRLISVTGTNSMSLNYTSNKNGNINYKSDAGTYSYDDTPYAVGTITNAQNISTTPQSIEYYSFEKVKKITEGTKTAEFDYNADHQRIRMILKDNGSITKYHYYFGSSCEREIVGGTATNYIWIGGDAYTAKAVAKKVGSGSWTVYNIFRDHLGTITHLKNASTGVVDEYSFDAWGRRRDKDSWSYTLSSEPALFADRGFTSHEYLEDFKLYNMNGRLYDPVVGRFLSPDPFVQAPDFSQNFNRYSYCLNNPLKYTDPSGYKWDWRWLIPIFQFDDLMQLINDKTPKLRQKMSELNIPDFNVTASVNGAGNVNFKGNYEGQEVFNTENIDRSNAEQKVYQAMNDARQAYGETDREAYYKTINAFLLSTGVAFNELDNAGYWVGRTSKGAYRLYHYNIFKGNQYTSDSRLFQKLGVVGFFVGESVDFSKLMDGSITKNQFRINTTLGISTLVAPEIGSGLLIWEGSQLYFELNRRFWDGPGGQWIYNGMYEMTNPANYDPDYYSYPWSY